MPDTEPPEETAPSGDSSSRPEHQPSKLEEALIAAVILAALAGIYFCGRPTGFHGPSTYHVYYSIWYSFISPLSGITFLFPWTKGLETGLRASGGSLCLGIIIGTLAYHKKRSRPFLRGIAGAFAPLPFLIGWIPCAAIVIALTSMSSCFPKSSYSETLETLSPSQTLLRDNIREHVRVLAVDIGERSLYSTPAALEKAAQYIEGKFQHLGYEVEAQPFSVTGKTVRNLEVMIPGTAKPDEILVVGAHYDSSLGTPAANDNGSGVAALLELARLLKGKPGTRTLKLVALTNEEPPYFHTADMGSVRYARRARERRENIIGMLALETIGYYSDKHGSQRYPPGLDAFYPNRGNFITFVGNPSSYFFTRKCVRAFRESEKFPSEAAALPGFLPGVNWSDHWSFWQEGYNAVMVTDTAPFRYDHYHEPTDTPDKIDYDRMTRVVEGLAATIEKLINE